MTDSLNLPDPPARRPHTAGGRALGAEGGASKRGIVAWAMWDWGTQPFNTVITTFVFSVYITSKSFGPTDPTSQALGVSTAIAGFFIAVLAPVLGQSADRHGHTVRDLRWLTWVLALISAALYFIAPDPKFLYFGLALLAVGTVISEIASVNYNSLLNRVATEHNVGRVSGFGWGMGYLGGIIVLLAAYFLLIKDNPILPVPDHDSLGIRLSMIVCGVWTLLFTIPTFLSLRDKRAAGPAGSQNIGVVASYVALGRTIQRLWQTSRQTLYFLMASALFRDGLAGVFAFGAVIASGTFGFSSGDVIIFGAAANVTAGVATMAVGLLDDRLGPKTVILTTLVILVGCGLAIFILHDQGAIVFWILGLVMSACVGPAQAASRSFLARLVPEGRSGEIFGLYATTGRVVSFLSPAMFAAMIGAGHLVLGSGTETQYWGILGIIVVLAAGLAVMIPVKPVSEHSTIEGSD
ncbi:MAG: MFS transporter [Propionibacteriaceae bacterium]|jgi:UMF1 family MFS transporter|nr:MFS transporter [Propionibacteriaceae bacterium]